MDGIPSHLPSLQRSQKLQKKAAKQGFDWDKISSVVDKLDEEVAEFKNAVQSGLGAAFLPVVSIEREIIAGTIFKPTVADLKVSRQLKLISHPSRYCSRAAEAFRNDILPAFASKKSPIRNESIIKE